MSTEDGKTQQEKTQEPAETKKTTRAKETFIVTGCVKHGGEIYQDGDPLELSAKDSEPLLAVGAIRELKKKDS